MHSLEKQALGRDSSHTYAGNRNIFRSTWHIYKHPTSPRHPRSLLHSDRSSLMAAYYMQYPGNRASGKPCSQLVFDHLSLFFIEILYFISLHSTNDSLECREWCTIITYEQAGGEVNKLYSFPISQCYHQHNLLILITTFFILMRDTESTQTGTVTGPVKNQN